MLRLSCTVLALSYLLGNVHERVKDDTFADVGPANAQWTSMPPAAPRRKWWTTFDDATLVSLVERLHAKSLDSRRCNASTTDAALRGANAMTSPG